MYTDLRDMGGFFRRLSVVTMHVQLSPGLNLAWAADEILREIRCQFSQAPKPSRLEIEIGCAIPEFDSAAFAAIIKRDAAKVFQEIGVIGEPGVAITTGNSADGSDHPN